MIKFAEDALIPDSSEQQDGQHGKTEHGVHGRLSDAQREFGSDIKKIVPELPESSSHQDALQRVREPLTLGQRFENQEQAPTQPEHAAPELPFPLEATSTQAATGIETPVYPTLDSDIRTVAKTGLVGAGVGAAALGGATALELAAAGAPTAAIATAGGLSALAGAWNVGLGVAGTYVGGMLHKLVWDTPPDKSGFLQTMGRGIIAPVSVPVGVLYRVFRKK